MTSRPTSRRTGRCGGSNYDAVAELVWSAGERLVGRVGVQVGQDVLDVACGTGNATIPAAEAGASVVGLDLTPELFARARERADEAGVAIDWVEGDAESLPFPDASFDVVLSTFGCQFAPRHDVTARELARVLRPDGRLGVGRLDARGLRRRLLPLARRAPRRRRPTSRRRRFSGAIRTMSAGSSRAPASSSTSSATRSTSASTPSSTRSATTR